jgi:hypothetical protein
MAIGSVPSGFSRSLLLAGYGSQQFRRSGFGGPAVKLPSASVEAWFMVI